MKKIIPTAGVVIIRGGRVLLVRHGDKAEHLTGAYGLPAGRIREGETALETAKRELQEETGLMTKKENLIEYPGNEYVGKIIRKDGAEKIFPYKVFICTAYLGRIRGMNEAEPQWIDLGVLEDVNLLINVYQIIQDARNYLNGQKI
jgi:ADP-ribose pyrophosphatase YjhB (NUDIX family)